MSETASDTGSEQGEPDRLLTPVEILAGFPVPLLEDGPGGEAVDRATVSVLSQDRHSHDVRPDVFFIPPIDKKARSERINARIDPASFSAIQRLVESGIFGWTSTSDFMRWSMDTGIQIAGRALRNPQLSNELQVARGIMRRYQARERDRIFASMIQVAIAEVRSLEALGAHGDAKQEFATIVREAKSLSIEVLRDRFLTELIAQLPDFWIEWEAEQGAEMDAADRAGDGGDNETD